MDNPIKAFYQIQYLTPFFQNTKQMESGELHLNIRIATYSNHIPTHGITQDELTDSNIRCKVTNGYNSGRIH